MTGKERQMDKVQNILNHIAEMATTEWRDNLLVDAKNLDKEATAYNEGVRSMSETICNYINAIIYGMTFKGDK